MSNINNMDLPKYLHTMPSEYELYIEYGYHNLPVIKKILYRTYLRTILSERQGHRCCYCYRLVNDTPNSSIQCTLEHVIPESKGGPTDLWNCVVACAKCNRNRGNDYSVLQDEVVFGRGNEEQFVITYGESPDKALDGLGLRL